MEFLLQQCALDWGFKITQIGFNELEYVPTIFLRPAEMNALEHLSETDRDRIIPIILLKPWATSIKLENSIIRIETAFPNRRYFLDLDPYFENPASERDAVVDFERLKSLENNRKHWREFVENNPNIIPSILITTDFDSVFAQIEWASNLGRGFLIRIQKSFGISPDFIPKFIPSVDHNEYVVCLDVGWGPDILFSEQWATEHIEKLVKSNPQVRIVVSGSSFPSSFTQFGEHGEQNALEHILFGNLKKNLNLANLIYGDWASSRPPLGGGGGTIVPRIDLPKTTSWLIFRSKDSNGSYKENAISAMENWAYDENVWGEYIINNTKIGSGYVIDSPKKCTEARINIHLHNQISHETLNPGQFVEEDFTD